MLTETGVVYKYFDLIDGFIRVRVLAGDEPLPLPWEPAGRPPDRREYRRLVVKACVLGLDEVVLPRVRQVYPEDAAAAEDLLYQICVDVNPRLEIHTVALPADAHDGEAGAAAAPDFRRRADELERLVLLEIVGQDESVRRICLAVRKASCGLKDPNRPVGSFLLVGRTGTGKTELAKVVARHLFGPDRLVRVDCTEYALPHETAKLIGAPPGYVGHNEGGTLTESLLRNPRAVVLFDEVEKGHEKLHNVLLQILDEGRLTDSKGRTASLREALVLMTSNVGTADYAEAAQRMGFERHGPLPEEEFAALTQAALRRSFRPEFLNRLDGVLVFNPLAVEACGRIAGLQLERLAGRARNAGVDLCWAPDLPGKLGQLGYSEEFGAREVRRTVDRMVEEPFALAVLQGRFRAGDHVTASWRAGAVTLQRRRGRRR